MKETKKKVRAIDMYLRMRSPKHIREMVDSLGMLNYFAGQFGGPMPVDETRELFEHIKKLLAKSNEQPN